MPKPIKFAVFPVAGKGTRFLPATKASPKEMLPVVDKPLIQHAVEEALAAGATNLVFITGAFLVLSLSVSPSRVLGAHLVSMAVVLLAALALIVLNQELIEGGEEPEGEA